MQVRDVYKYYGSVKAVRGITFGIDVGTCFGLLGINGAGGVVVWVHEWVRLCLCAAAHVRPRLGRSSTM